MRTKAEIEAAKKKILDTLPRGTKKAMPIAEIAIALGVPQDSRLASDLAALRKLDKIKTVGERSKMRYHK